LKKMPLSIFSMRYQAVRRELSTNAIGGEQKERMHIPKRGTIERWAPMNSSS